MNKQCTGCVVSAGTHKPAEALHQIDEPQAEALQLADECEESATHWVNEIDTRAKAAKLLRAQHALIVELEDTLQFVERWAVHHGSKPSISAQEALSCIQHYPAIHEITKSYKDGKRPDTFNPYARIAELESQLEAIGASVESLRKPAAAPQAVQAAVPLFWVRLLRDGLYEGPVHNNSVGGKMLRDEKPGEWHPLYLHTAPAHPAEGVPAQCQNINEPRGCWRVACQLGGKCREPERSAAQPAAQGIDIVQAAKALCKHAAKVQNINFDDYWLIHAEEFKEEAKIVLDAAKAKQGEQQCTSARES